MVSQKRLLRNEHGISVVPKTTQGPELLVIWLLSPLLILPVLCITQRHREEGRNAQALAKGQREDGGVEKAGMSTRVPD